MGYNQKKYSKKFFFDSLSEHAIFNLSETMDSNEVNFLARDVKWENITDDVIKYNDDLLSKLDWGLYIDKARALRISISNLSDHQSIEEYPLHIYEYHFSEVINAVCVYPELLGIVNLIGEITFEELLEIATVKPEILSMYEFNTEGLDGEDLLKLIRLGNKEFINSVMGDSGMETLPPYDRFKIIVSSGYDHSIIGKVGAFDEDFDNSYYVREIIIHTGEVFFEMLNTEVLTPNDWVKIIKFQRHLSDYINVEDLVDGDPSFLIELCMMVPDFTQYITKDNSDRISSRGWGKLLVKYGKDEDNRIINLCDFNKLEKITWGFIQKEKPELLLYKL